MRGALCLFFALSLWGAEDPRLAKLRGVLSGIVAKPQPDAPRGATPALTAAKHLLREWVESRLADQRLDLDTPRLERTWNVELATASPPGPRPVDDQFQSLAAVGRISVKRQQDIFLVVITRLGVYCGYDESVYLYRWTLGRWQFALAGETNDYSSNEKYRPQSIQSVMVSEPAQDGPGFEDRLVLVLGINPWCSSTWQPLYHRVWRLKADQSPTRLLHSGEALAKVDAGTRGGASARDVVVEHWTFGMQGDHRQEVRRFVLEGNRLVRRDPVALRPFDFLQWWIESPWPDVEPWTEAAVRASAKSMHPPQRFDRYWERVSQTWCPQEPDLWQLALASSSMDSIPFQRKGQEQHWYFLVRWRPPYRFRLAGVSHQPRAGCTEPDPEADALRTLFPPQPR